MPRNPENKKSEVGRFAFEPTNLAFGSISRDFHRGKIKKYGSNLYHCYRTFVVRVERLEPGHPAKLRLKLRTKIIA